MTPTGNAYLDKGTSNSDGTYNVNAHVTGTGDVTLKSGGDTNLKGAVVEGNSVTANIGGNLNIESQVDTQNVGIDHKTISGGFGGGGASFDYTSQTANGEVSTVSEQSGIHAGKGGFDLKVDGNTDLKGGVITSTAPEDKNKLETGTLSWSDIETGSEWETKTSGFGGTIGTGASGAAGSGPLFKPTLKDGDKDSGSAKSAISSGQITITNPEGQHQDLAALNRDTTNTNDEIKGLPDLQAKLNEQLKTQQEWTQAAANMATAVRDFADSQLAKAQNAGDENAEALWKEGGAARAALHAIAGGLLGGVNGVDAAIKSAIAAGVSTLIAPYINDIVKEAVAQSGLTGEDAKRMSDTLTSSIVLGLLAGAGGSDAAAYASNEIKYNYLSFSDNMAKKDAEKKCDDGDLSSCALAEELQAKDDKQQAEWKACSLDNKKCTEKIRWDVTVAASSYSGITAFLNENDATDVLLSDENLDQLIKIFLPKGNAYTETEIRNGMKAAYLLTKDPTGVTASFSVVDALLKGDPLAIAQAILVLTKIKVPKGAGKADDILDGGAPSNETNKQTIPYDTDKTVLNQMSHATGGSNLCGPTSCAMIINDSKG